MVDLEREEVPLVAMGVLMGVGAFVLLAGAVAAPIGPLSAKLVAYLCFVAGFGTGVVHYGRAGRTYSTVGFALATVGWVVGIVGLFGGGREVTVFSFVTLALGGVLLLVAGLKERASEVLDADEAEGDTD